MATIFDDLIRTFVKSTDGATYGFGHSGKVYKINADLYCLQVYDHGAAIKGAAEWALSTGTSYFYFATDTGLYRKPVTGLSNWNDVTSVETNLTSADFHTMREAGGALVIANAGTLAMVGYDGSYTNNALDLIPGNIAKTLLERDGRAIIGTSRTADPSRGVNGMVDAEFPLAQVGDGDIFYANMIDSIPVKRLPGGGKVNPGGVCNEIDQVNFFEWEQDALSWIDKQAVGNMALFGIWNADEGYGGIYSVGRRNKNHPFVTNLEYKLDVDEIGAVINSNGITMASYRFGSSYGVMAVDELNKATATYRGLDFKAPVKNPVNITNWKYAELFMAPLPSGCSVEFWYRVNKTGSFIQANLADGSGTDFSTANGTKAVFMIGAEGEIFEPQVVLNSSGNYTAEIFRIRTYFS